jgi:hypothetical protein
MVTLKELHESLVLYDNNQKYYLHSLSENILKRAVDYVRGSSEETESGPELGEAINILSSYMTGLNATKTIFPFPSLKNAVGEAQADATKAIRAGKEDRNFYGIKIQKFYRHMKNFLSSLKKFPMLSSPFKDFITSPSVPNNFILKNHPQSKDVENLITNYFTGDAGMGARIFKKISGSSIFSNQVPYLDFDQFINDFMGQTRNQIVQRMNQAANAALMTDDQLQNALNQIEQEKIQAAQAQAQEQQRLEQVASLNKDAETVFVEFNKILNDLSNLTGNQQITTNANIRNEILGMIFQNTPYAQIKQVIIGKYSITRQEMSIITPEQLAVMQAQAKQSGTFTPYNPTSEPLPQSYKERKRIDWTMMSAPPGYVSPKVRQKIKPVKESLKRKIYFLKLLSEAQKGEQDPTLEQSGPKIVVGFNKIIAALDSIFTNQNIANDPQKKEYIFNNLIMDQRRNFEQIYDIIYQQLQGARR